jgi:GT2 family glycosyltransferase
VRWNQRGLKLLDNGVTVVVPTLNRGSVLIDCLKDLLQQRHRPLEILVVDQSDESSPEMRELAERRPDIINWHRVSFRGLPMARNYGWQHARHDAIVYLDDDVRCGPALASEHLRALKLPNVGVVAGGIDEAWKPADQMRRPGVFDLWVAESERGFAARSECDVDHAPGGNFSVWRPILRDLDGIDEGLQVGAALYEETDFCLRVKRAGHRIYFNGCARVTHLAVGDGGCRIGEVASYVYGLAHNRALLIRRHLRWYHVPTALARLALLGGSYAVHYRAPRALWACVSGCLAGWKKGTRLPVCTRY